MPRIRPAISPAPKSRLEIPDVSAIAARTRGRRQIGTPKDIAFRLPEHPPGVKPVKGSGMAMDEMPGQSEALAWAAGQAIASAFHEGIGFLGYTYLAELAQRPEYRVIVETIAEEMTRKWIRVQAKSGKEDKGERIKELNTALEDMNVREVFRISAVNDGFFGRSHIYIDTGDGDDRDELQTSIGGGRDKMSKAKISRNNPVIALRPVEAVWTYPTNYNSNDPLSPSWYRPDVWFVMGKPIHRTRLITIVGRPVPDMLKPAYSFGGLSMSQMAKPYVDNWLRTRQSVSDLIHSFTVFALSTDMSQLLRKDGDQLFRRMELFTSLRDNSGLFLRDKDTEEFDNISAPLGTLDALQAASQQHMASVARTPIIKLFGIQPAGLNASSEGEIRTFYDTIHAMQDRLFRPDLRIVIDFLMLSLWGEVDEEITFDFEPLWSLDEKGEAEVRKTNAETAQIHIETGIISPEEERMRVARDPATPYEGLDPTELPDLKEEEEEGLGVPGRGAGEPGGSAEGEPDKPNGESDKRNGESDKEGAEDRILPFDAAPEPAQDEWNESDHPRGQPENAGQFGPGGGGSPKKAPSAAAEPTAGAGVAKKKKPPEGFKSHRAHIGHLLKDKGVTVKEVLDITGWPSVSMPSIAKSLGLELVKKKEGKVTKYFGIEKKDTTVKQEQTKTKVPPPPPPPQSEVRGGMSPQQLEGVAKTVSAKMGFDHSKISIRDDDMTFVLNGRTMNYAGAAYLGSGRIELFRNQISEKSAAGITAHEIEHQKFQKVLDAANAESVALSLRGEHDAKKGPIYKALHDALHSVDIGTFEIGDGVSWYSLEYWEGYKKGTVSRMSAMHETLAEMARIKLETGKMPEPIGPKLITYRGSNRPSKAIVAKAQGSWRKLFRTVDQIYKGLPK